MSPFSSARRRRLEVFGFVLTCLCHFSACGLGDSRRAITPVEMDIFRDIPGFNGTLL